jgi:hypothetical protein
LRKLKPAALLDCLRAAQAWGRWFATVENAACALFDHKLHSFSKRELAAPDFPAFEAALIESLGKLAGVGLWRRPSPFLHLFVSFAYRGWILPVRVGGGLGRWRVQRAHQSGDICDAAKDARARRCIYDASGSVERGAT